MEFIWLLVLDVSDFFPMILSDHIRDKIFLMEEVINFPTSLMNHRNYQWENLSMVPYSDLMVEVSSPAESQTGEAMP